LRFKGFEIRVCPGESAEKTFKDLTAENAEFAEICNSEFLGVLSDLCGSSFFQIRVDPRESVKKNLRRSCP
jgi:hypothetical protein